MSSDSEDSGKNLHEKEEFQTRSIQYYNKQNKGFKKYYEPYPIKQKNSNYDPNR
jgi:hypothetical protein